MGVTQQFAAPAHPGTIVIVDDEPLVLRALVRQLECTKFVLAPCLTPHEGIRQIANGGVRVVVSDVALPEMSGIELLRTIRQHDADLPVILVTGRPAVESAAQALEFGAFKYFVKPVDGRQLVDAVDRAARLYDLAQAKRQAITLLGDRHLDEDRAGLEATFERALKRVWLAYQPIIRASDHSIFGFEALLRSDERSMMGPEPLLQAAESLGALNRLGQAIRRQAAKTISTAPRSYALFVNLHPQDLLDADLHDAKAALSSISGRVVLEITERAAISEIENVRARVAELRDHGFRIAIDDLGAGYAGLNSFAVLEPEFVKLDLSLIRNLDTSTIKQKLVKSMASLCREMGLYVVAEGIETREERDAAVEFGCDLLQGYLFARPGPPFPEARW